MAKKLSKHLRDWWLGGITLPSFSDIGGPLQWLFSDNKRIDRVKADGFTYLEDKANQGTDRLIRRGSALSFGGINGAISIPHSSLLTFGNGVIDQPFSISAWIIFNNTTTRLIYTKGDYNNSGISFFTSAGNLYLRLTSSTGNRIGRFNSGLSTGVVYNVLCTYTGGGSESDININVHTIDGTVIGSLVGNSPGVYTQLPASTQIQYIGRDFLGVGDYNGTIWDLRVHDTVLTIAESQALVDNPNYLTGHEVGIWHLDEEAGSTAFDSSGNGNNGTLSGGLTRVNQDVVSFPNYSGFIVSDGSTYYANDNDTGLIPINVIIPALDAVNSVAYLSGGSRAPLTYTGKAPKDGRLIKSSCGTFDGIGDEVDYGPCGSTTKISLYIRSIVDNQYLLSLDNAATKAVYVSAGVLAFGSSLSASNIKVDGVAKNATEAGALLNNNLIHRLEFDLSSVTCTDVRLGRSDTSYGNIEANGFVLDELNSPLAEGDGLVAYDASGNGNHGTIVATASAFWANTQDLYHYNLINGWHDGESFFPYFSDFIL